MDAALGTLTTPPAGLRSTDGALRVEASPAAPPAQQRVRAAQTAAPSTSDDRADSRREVREDVSTGSFVFRVIDVTTGSVERQTPSEARLKLRAYIDNVVSQQLVEPVFEATA